MVVPESGSQRPLPSKHPVGQTPASPDVCVWQEPAALHTWLDVHATHLAPETPQLEWALVPLPGERQVPLESQQPFLQVVGLQGAGVTHAPAVQVSPVLHATHAVAPTP